MGKASCCKSLVTGGKFWNPYRGGRRALTPHITLSFDLHMIVLVCAPHHTHAKFLEMLGLLSLFLQERLIDASIFLRSRLISERQNNC